MPTLKQLSIALGLLTSEHSAAVDVDGWQGYVWRIRDVSPCNSISDHPCKILEDRWDWKRPQYYDFSLQIDIHNNKVISRIGLNNQDKTDRDDVCVVASFLDGNGMQLGILFANWPSLPGRAYARSVPIRLTMPVSDIKQVAVGTKQCERTAAADVQNYQRLRQQLKQR